MTTQDFDDLKPGDLIRNGLSKNYYLVVANPRDGSIAAIPCTMFNHPCEWKLINVRLLGERREPEK